VVLSYGQEREGVTLEQIAFQVEGSIVYGPSSLLYGECTVRDGRIEQTNFDTREVMRLDEMRQVEVVVAHQHKQRVKEPHKRSGFLECRNAVA
jgi:CO/xanthine dehydrogenase Mo-binding subunit